MANRFPLIVDSYNQNIKELPDGDSLLLGDSEKLLLGDGTDLQLYHDGSNSYLANSTGALKLATETSGIAITIGHSTSETTIGDNSNYRRLICRWSNSTRDYCRHSWSNGIK